MLELVRTEGLARSRLPASYSRSCLAQSNRPHEPRTAALAATAVACFPWRFLVRPVMVEAWFHCLIDLAGTAYWTGHGFDPDPASERIVRFRTKRAAQQEARRLARRGIGVRYF
jgi:hypothetical protein